MLLRRRCRLIGTRVAHGSTRTCRNSRGSICGWRHLRKKNGRGGGRRSNRTHDTRLISARSDDNSAIGSDRPHGIEIGLAAHVRGLLVTRPLHLLSIHPHAQIRPSSQKQLVIIRPGVDPLRNPSKTVEVQLPLKGGQFALPEVIVHDLGGEYLGLADDEGSSVG